MQARRATEPRRVAEPRRAADVSPPVLHKTSNTKLPAPKSKLLTADDDFSVKIDD
jgi:hypothetical protein